MPLGGRLAIIMSGSGKICLGIDWGEKRIGLALGDTETKIATPLQTVESLSDILEMIREEGADIAVVGAPYKYPDSRELSPEFRKFLEDFREKAGIQIVTVDERLTSKEADILPGDKKMKAGRDALAAMLILQQYLNEL